MLILVVEDEPLIAFAVEWTLKLAGHDILGPADSVEDAIGHARARRPDLALIDLNLRDGGDGVDVARYLHDYHRTPCLYLSAQVAHARMNRDVAIGLVRKPYDTMSLPNIVHYVENVLQGKPPEQTPPEIEIFRPSRD